MSKTKADTWDGLSYEELCGVIMEYCRAQTRVQHLGGQSAAVCEHGAPAMCGRLIGRFLSHCKRIRNGKQAKPPTNKKLAAELTSRELPINQGKLGDWLNGTFSSGNAADFWYQATWELMELLLLGFSKVPGDGKSQAAAAPQRRAQQGSAPEQAGDGEKQEAAADMQRGSRVSDEEGEQKREEAFKIIRTYFLGPKKGEPPEYMSWPRRTMRGTATQEETLAGVRRLLYVHEARGPLKGRFVVVAGDVPFAQGLGEGVNGLDEMGEVTVELAQKEFDIYFLFPDPETAGPSQAQLSATRFIDAVKKTGKTKALGHIHPVPIPLTAARKSDSGSTQRGTDFLNALERYTYVQYEERNASAGPRSEVNLYVTRPLLPRDGDQARWTPDADPVSPKECERFREWLEAFLPKDDDSQQRSPSSEKKKGKDKDTNGSSSKGSSKKGTSKSPKKTRRNR